MQTFDIVALAVLCPLTVGAFVLLYLLRHQAVQFGLVLTMLGFLLWVDAYWVLWKSGVPTSDLPAPPGSNTQ
jgi:hypothetical protein